MTDPIAEGVKLVPELKRALGTHGNPTAIISAAAIETIIAALTAAGKMPNCCLNTPDPGPWTAGVDDSADTEMINTMHSIRDGLSAQTPNDIFAQKLRAAVQIDNRTLLGRDIQRCLLSGAAERLSAVPASPVGEGK